MPFDSDIIIFCTKDFMGEKNMEQHITAPLTKQEAAKLKSGDYVYITGTIYTARDAAHKRMFEALQNNEPLPMEMKDNIIYYGTIPCARWKTDWIRRTHNCKPDG